MKWQEKPLKGFALTVKGDKFKLMIKITNNMKFTGSCHSIVM